MANNTLEFTSLYAPKLKADVRHNGKLYMNGKSWTPAPLGVVPQGLFTRGEIEAYEKNILGNSSATETDASRFFAKHPKFLHLWTGAEVRREVVLLGSDSAPNYRVDFFRRCYGRPFWDIVELKDPKKPFATQVGGLHPRVTAEVNKAIDQALDYRDLIAESGEVRAYLKQKGIWVCRPQILVVVGKHDDSLDPEILQVLYDRIRERGPIDAWSYTDIYDFAKEHYEKNSVIVVPSTHFSENDSIVLEIAWEKVIEHLAGKPDSLFDLQPRKFEELVAHLLESFGYDVALTPYNRDAGRDIIAVHHGPLSEIKYLVECKRYGKGRKVGIAHIRSILGVVQTEGATGGIIATTSQFTKTASQFLADGHVRWLVQGKDHDAVVEWLKRYGDLLQGRPPETL